MFIELAAFGAAHGECARFDAHEFHAAKTIRCYWIGCCYWADCCSTVYSDCEADYRNYEGFSGHGLFLSVENEGSKTVPVSRDEAFALF
jgi:hypothetical protein